MLNVNLYPSWEVILENLSEIYDFKYENVGRVPNSYNRLQHIYKISPVFFARKRDLDEYIQAGKIGGSEYARASVLYSLYACSCLKVEVHGAKAEEKVAFHQHEQQRQIQPKNQEYYALAD
jgi:hypothetical protein